MAYACPKWVLVVEVVLGYIRFHRLDMALKNIKIIMSILSYNHIDLDKLHDVIFEHSLVDSIKSCLNNAINIGLNIFSIITNFCCLGVIYNDATHTLFWFLFTSVSKYCLCQLWAWHHFEKAMSNDWIIKLTFFLLGRKSVYQTNHNKNETQKNLHFFKLASVSF